MEMMRLKTLSGMAEMRLGFEQGTGIYLYELKVNDKPYEVKRLILLR